MKLLRVLRSDFKRYDNNSRAKKENNAALVSGNGE
jgi:hypothetical protein